MAKPCLRFFDSLDEMSLAAAQAVVQSVHEKQKAFGTEPPPLREKERCAPGESGPAESRPGSVGAASSILHERGGDEGDFVFTIALAGGSTPRRLYELLADKALCSEIPWEKVHVFWGDERCVPPDHADSNVRMARETLLTRIPIPERNIHMPRCDAPPKKAAEEYERELRRFFQNIARSPGGRTAEESFPSFDLILLGMGTDGHVASLFPGRPALEETERWVVDDPKPGLPPYVPRITLTFPIINAASRVFLLASGEEKAEVLAAAWRDRENAREYPVARVAPRGQFVGFLAHMSPELFK